MLACKPAQLASRVRNDRRFFVRKITVGSFEDEPVHIFFAHERNQIEYFGMAFFHSVAGGRRIFVEKRRGENPADVCPAAFYEIRDRKLIVGLVIRVGIDHAVESLRRRREIFYSDTFIHGGHPVIFIGFCAFYADI